MPFATTPSAALDKPRACPDPLPYDPETGTNIRRGISIQGIASVERLRSGKS